MPLTSVRRGCGGVEPLAGDENVMSVLAGLAHGRPHVGLCGPTGSLLQLNDGAWHMLWVSGPPLAPRPASPPLPPHTSSPC